MKTYRVEFVNFGTEKEPIHSDAVDLVNVEDDTDRIFAADDEFTIGEIITEDQFYIKPCTYVDDIGSGIANFAFKKITMKDLEI